MNEGERRASVGGVESRLVQVPLSWVPWWWKWAAGAGGVGDSGKHLKSRQSEGWGRRIVVSSSAWAVQWYLGHIVRPGLISAHKEQNQQMYLFILLFLRHFWEIAEEAQPERRRISFNSWFHGGEGMAGTPSRWQKLEKGPMHLGASESRDPRPIKHVWCNPLGPL